MDLLRDITRREKIRNVLGDQWTVEQLLETQDDGDGLDDKGVAAADGSAAEAQGLLDDDPESEEEEGGEGEEVEESAAVAQIEGVGKPEMVLVSQVTVLLPSGPEIPFPTSLKFHDRLGVFLSDGAQMQSGTYPTPDDGQIAIYSSFRIPSERSFRVHARPSFHGRPRYDWVQVNPNPPSDELWFARVWLLFSCTFQGKQYGMAMLSWLKSVSSEPYHTRRPTFVWASRFPNCIELGNLIRTVTMLPSFVKRGASREEAFHLLDRLEGE